MANTEKFIVEIPVIAGDVDAFTAYSDQGTNGLLTSIINFAFAPFLEARPFTEAGYNVMGWEPNGQPDAPWNLLVEVEDSSYDSAFEAALNYAGDGELDPEFEEESDFTVCNLADFADYDHDYDEKGLPVWSNGEGGFLAVHEVEHLLAIQKLWADLRATDGWKKRITIVTERYPELVKRRVEKYPFLKAYVTI